MTERLPVSVIIPVKNGARFIKEAIESVLTEPIKEVLVVDDHSTDDTMKIVNEAVEHHPSPPFMYTLELSRSTGPGAARNMGLKFATQPWIAFLDADDVWLPGKTVAQLNAFGEAKERDYRRAFVSSKVEHFVGAGFEAPAELRTDKLGAIDLMTPSNLIAHREVFSFVGGFDPNLPCTDDVDWYHRALTLGIERVHVPDVLVRKRVHDTNLSLHQGHDMQRQIFETLKRPVTERMFSVW